MKLHSPTFESALRRGMKTAIAESPALQKEYRRARKFTQRQIPAWLKRGCLSIGCAIVLWLIAVKSGHVGTALAGLALWSFGWVLVQAQRLAQLLENDNDALVLHWLPAAEETIFRWQTQRFVWASAFCLVDLGIGLGTLAWYAGLSPGQWLAVPLLAALAWVQLLALAALCLLYVPETIRGLLMFGMTVGSFIALFTLRVVALRVLAKLDQLAPYLNEVLPTGWPLSLFQLLLPGRQWPVLLLLPPTLLTIGTLVLSRSRLRAGLRWEELIQPTAPPPRPGEESDFPHGEDGNNSRPDQPGLTAIADLIQTRQFLTSERWGERGWWEGRLWRWLNARDRVLVEFAFPDGFVILRPWTRIFRLLLIFWLAGALAGMASATLQGWVFGLGLLITGSRAAFQILRTGNAFRLELCSGVKIPLYASFGIGYREMARLLLKCSAIQWPIFLLFLLLASLTLAWWRDYPALTAAMFGCKTGFLAPGARLIMLMGNFSAGTNDTTRWRVGSVIIILVLAVLGLAFVGLGAGGLFCDSQPRAWCLVLLAGLDAWLMFAIYGWWHNATRFDLMSLPR